MLQDDRPTYIATQCYNFEDLFPVDRLECMSKANDLYHYC